jgi:hypothetical protein
MITQTVFQFHPSQWRDWDIVWRRSKQYWKISLFLGPVQIFTSYSWPR